MIHELDPIWKILRSTSVQQPPRRWLVFPHADLDAQLAQLQPRPPMRRERPRRARPKKKQLPPGGRSHAEGEGLAAAAPRRTRPFLSVGLE